MSQEGPTGGALPGFGRDPAVGGEASEEPVVQLSQEHHAGGTEPGAELDTPTAVSRQPVGSQPVGSQPVGSQPVGSPTDASHKLRDADGRAGAGALVAAPPWRRNRLPLVVVTLGVALLAAPSFIVLVHGESEGRPLWTAIALVVWLLYGLPLLWLILKLDFFQPQPVSTIAAALGWGALVATGLVFSLNADLRALIGALFGQSFQQTWASVIAAPITEELAKGLGVYVVLLLASQRPHTPIDGLIVGAAVGLGFQVAENLVYTVRTMPLMGEAQAIEQVLRVRGFLGGLWSHALYTAIFGYGIGYAVVRRRSAHRSASWSKRLLVVVVALLGGAGLHALWNSPLVADPRSTGPGQLVKGMIALGFFAFFLAAGQRREAAVFLPYLADPDSGRGLASLGEQQDLRDGWSRLKARSVAARLAQAGLARRWTAWRQQAKLQRAQADAAVALAFSLAGPLTLARGQVHGARTALRRVCGARGSAVPPVVGVIAPAPPPARARRLPSLQQGRSVSMLSLVMAVFGFLEPAIALGALALAAVAWRLSRGSAPARSGARLAVAASTLSLLVSGALSLWQAIVG